MSLSKLLAAGLKRKIEVNVENEGSSNKIRVQEVSTVQKKKECKRKCAVNGCEEKRKLHNFPYIYKRVKHEILEDPENLARTEKWVHFCDNQIVSTQPRYSLHDNFYVCSNHFKSSDYTYGLKKRLKSFAVPTIKEFSQEGPSTSQAGLSCGRREETVDVNESSSLENFEDNKEHDLAIHDSGNIQQQQQQANEEKLDSVVSKHEILNEHSYVKVINDSKEKNFSSQNVTFESTTEKKFMKICCMGHCFNSNKNHSMFGFPNILSKKSAEEKIDSENLKRFIDWVVSCGISELIFMNPFEVHKKFAICDSHFDDSDFTSTEKKRLKQDAIPKLNCNPIRSIALIEEYTENIKKWIESSFEEYDMFTKSACAFSFEEDMSSLTWKICDTCNERILISNLKKMNVVKNKCQHEGQCWKYSDLNDMDPGEQPEELKGLTFIEEQVIARIHPVITVFKVKAHQYAYKGNVISFPQDVQEVANQLPHKVQDLNSVVCIKYEKSSGEYHDFYIRQERVRKALQWLQKNNPLYKDIHISEENLMMLPKDGYVTDQILSVSLQNEIVAEMNIEEEEEDLGDSIHQSGVLHNVNPNQDEAVNKCLKWGMMSKDPVNEKNTPGFIPLAFPTLYPFGTADLNSTRTKEVKTADYFRHLMNYKDSRFAQHPTFRFFAYNVWQRWTALTDGSLFVRNNKEFQNMTITQLKDLVAENPNIMKQIMYQASNIKGSKAYWNARSHELRDMVEQIGLPTVFLTLSCADGHWEDLYKIMTSKDVTTLSAAEKRKLVQDNPHIVDSFFDYRVNSFIKKVLQTHYKVTDYWYRIEYQHRGSPHIHGLFWIKDSPDVSNIENESSQYVEEVIEYFSKLITAWNPIINPTKADTHPCRTSYQNVENFEEDLAQLLHMVQRHVCSPDYCYRVNKKTKKRECRFKFPREMQDEASMNKNEKNETEFRPKRNDPHLNKFNAFLIQLWRANMDIAPVISPRALLAYLAKYISKCEIQSQSLHEIFSILIDSLDGDLGAKKVIHKVYMKCCAERDISAQEVCHSLLRLKLHSAGGRQFVIVNLSDKKWLQVEDDEIFDNDKHGRSVVEKYKNRPNRLENLTLWNFAKTLNMSTLSEVTKFNIVRVFPKLKLSDDDTKNELFYRQQFILHVPWRDETMININDEPWQDLFKRYNLQDEVNATTRLTEDAAQKIQDEEYESSDDDVSDDEETNLLGELLSSRLGPKSNIPQISLGNREVDTSYNWIHAFENYKQYGTIVDFENYIDKMKTTTLNHENDNVLPNVTLTSEQQGIINVVTRHIQTFKAHKQIDDRCEPIKRIIVQGKAGTGKSLIIKYLTSLLQKELGNDSYLLASPTGVSAVLINGKTLHSIFKLPRKSTKFTSLKGEQARDLTNLMKNVKFLILDEFSMIGCTTLAMINRRCKDAVNSEKDFGGLITILLGDIKQLPPVQDYSFYSKTQKSFLGKEGKVLINNFQKVYILKKSHRQAQDEKFLNIIDNLSELQVSESDYQCLSSRFTHNVSNDEKEKFKDSLRLFATKDEVKHYNMLKLSQLKNAQTGLPSPVLRIPAKHNCNQAKKESSDSAEGLERDLFLAMGCKIMLRTNLWIEQNLCNGTIGKIHEILYGPESDQVSVLLCKFPSYHGPSIIPGTQLVPVKPILKSWTSINNINCSRYQFPITVCYACSIHKSQGMTLHKAVINIGQTDFSLGLSYVALSRVKSLEDLLIDPFIYKRLLPSSRTLITLETRNDFLSYLTSLN